jgi:hypothetical protein
MASQNGEIVIHAGNAHRFVADPVVDGERKARGLIPRDYSQYPRGFYRGVKAVDIPLIPRSEWTDRIKDMEANKSRLSDMRVQADGSLIPSRDQNGRGYCWMHSGTTATIAIRMSNNLPYVSLSAYAGACIIKNYRDEGGWGAQGVDFLFERGIPSDQFWPQQSVSRSNDKPETWSNAALHKLTEEWADLQSAQYDRNLSFDQMMTCLLSRVPVVIDESWWSHSICAIDPAITDSSTLRNDDGKLLQWNQMPGHEKDAFDMTGGYGPRIWNSWGDTWSDKGMGLLVGSKGIPDSAVAPRSTVPSVS